MNILDTFKQYLANNRSVKMVADDSELTAELILLVRMMFIDGKLKTEERAFLQKLCEAAYGIGPDEFPAVLKFLSEFGYETSSENAASIFVDLPDERKRNLLLHMFSVAKSDNVIHPAEVELIRKTASMLNVTSADLVAAAQGAV